MTKPWQASFYDPVDQCFPLFKLLPHCLIVNPVSSVPPRYSSSPAHFCHQDPPCVFRLKTPDLYSRVRVIWQMSGSVVFLVFHPFCVLYQFFSIQSLYCFPIAIVLIFFAYLDKSKLLTTVKYTVCQFLYVCRLCRYVCMYMCVCVHVWLYICARMYACCMYQFSISVPNSGMFTFPEYVTIDPITGAISTNKTLVSRPLPYILNVSATSSGQPPLTSYTNVLIYVANVSSPDAMGFYIPESDNTHYYPYEVITILVLLTL